MKSFVNGILTFILSLLVAALTYLFLVWLFFKALIFLPFTEEIMWKMLIKDKIRLAPRNLRIDKMQDLIKEIPPYLLPKHYPKLELLLIEDDNETAYATAGGRILITTSLLNKVSDKTLFFVISHEIGHLTRRDHIYELSRLITKKYYFFLLRSDLFLEMLQIPEQKKLEQNENLSDLYAFKIIDILYENRIGILEEISQLSNKKTRIITRK